MGPATGGKPPRRGEDVAGDGGEAAEGRASVAHPATAPRYPPAAAMRRRRPPFLARLLRLGREAGSQRRVAPHRPGPPPLGPSFSDLRAPLAESRHGMSEITKGQVLTHVRQALALLPDVEAVRVELEVLLKFLSHESGHASATSNPSVCMSGMKLDGSVSDEELSEFEEEGIQEWLLDTLDLRTVKGRSAGSRESGAGAGDLMSYAASRGDVDQLRRLVKDQLVPVDTQGYDMRTALHVAAAEGMLEAVRCLIVELGADPSPVDRFGCTPLDDALRVGNEEVIDFLRLSARGVVAQSLPPVDEDRQVGTSWSGAALVMFDRSDLCTAAATGQVDVLRHLVKEQGRDVNAGDYDNRTALHLAASEGLLVVAQVLLEELDAFPSPVDRWGGTPLDDAHRTGHTAMIEYLLSKGSQRGLISNRSTRPVEMSTLWVAPDAIGRCFSGEYFAQLEVGEATQAMAARCLDSWSGDVLALNKASDGHAFLVIGEALLNRHQLFTYFKLDHATVRRFFAAAEAAYACPGCERLYHNSVHAADVAVSTHLFLTKFGQVERMTKTQLLATLLAALMHDFNHPNTINSHEVRVGSERAITHSDSSVLERHHLHSTFTLLSTSQFDILEPLSVEDRKKVRSLMIDLILATDLARHFEFVTKLRTMCATQGASSWASDGPWRSTFHEVDISFMLQVAIKFADLGHSTKSNELHREWTARAIEEFHCLGDSERELGIAISPLCDRRKDTLPAKSQLGFFRYICVPFYSLLADLIDPNMSPYVRLQENFRAWQLESMEHSATNEAIMRSSRVSKACMAISANVAAIEEQLISPGKRRQKCKPPTRVMTQPLNLSASATPVRTRSVMEGNLGGATWHRMRRTQSIDEKVSTNRPVL